MWQQGSRSFRGASRHSGCATAGTLLLGHLSSRLRSSQVSPGHGIDACLERVYTSAGPPVGDQASDQP